MRILVGILRTIENEFDECVASLQRQSHGYAEHFVLENLPKESACDTLYRKFMRRSDEFDLFVKLDADMVMERHDFLDRVEQAFAARPWMKLLSLPVQDFFTNQPIFGINIFRSGVEFPLNHDGLFTDQNPVSPEESVFGMDGFDGMVSRCKDPLPFQAFHYGLHRGLKARCGDLAGRWGRVAFHMRFHEALWRNFTSKMDSRLGLACLGGEMALRGDFAIEHVNYANPHAAQICEGFEHLSAFELRKCILKMRRRNFGMLPWPVRLGLVNQTKKGKWLAIASRVGSRLRRRAPLQ